VPVIAVLKSHFSLSPCVEIDFLKVQSEKQPQPAMAPSACFTKHLYEKTEVELSFQCAALEGASEEALYWLLELCESGWVGEAWRQLWIAFYDFYAPHNPQFEGELLELMALRGRRDRLRTTPLLHGASALIGRKRSVGAWLIRHGVAARIENGREVMVGAPNTEGHGPEQELVQEPEVHITVGGEAGPALEDTGAGPLRERANHYDAATVVEELFKGPVEAAEALAALKREYSDAFDQELWEVYEELVGRCGGEAEPEAWGTVPVDKIHIVCALLVFVNDEVAAEQEGNEGSKNLDLTPSVADRALVTAAFDLVKKTRATQHRDHLLLWRQYSPRREIGCLGVLARWQEGDGAALANSLKYGQDWLRYTRGCPYWTRTVRAYGGKRAADGQVIWADEDAEERFCAERDYDTEELPECALAAGANLFPKGTKLQWLKKVWNVKPRPELWTRLLQP
jgi:hypothetical protein